MKTTTRWSLTAALVAVSLLGAGCLIKETTHSLYLDPDGSLTWLVLQRDIRSDADEPEKRVAEERQFLAEMAAGDTALLRAFERLGAHHVESRLLRDRRPFAAATEGRFLRIEEVIQRFFDQLGIDGHAELVYDGPLARLTVTCSTITDDDGGAEEDEVLMSLIEEADRYRVVLTSGEFVDARGFELQHKTTAVLSIPSDEEIEAGGETVILSLAWTIEP